MSERLIPPDYDFAEQLDRNCNNCLHGYGNNTPQLWTIKLRKPITRAEGKALKGLKNQCEHCFKNGRSEMDSITASSSCHWRDSI